MTVAAAKALLKASAVQFSTDPMFTWASGIQSPIYCDNRLLMGYPELRERVAHELAQLIKEKFPEAGVVAGTATAGIPHAAWVSTLLNCPMLYVRSKAKEHGRGNQIEGRVNQGDKVVVIEDLISTGGSSLTAVEALRQKGVEVLGVVSIFSYGLPKAQQAFDQIGIPYYSLTNLEELLSEAGDDGKLSQSQMLEITNWHEGLKQKNA
ncbi:orotate phosphoribosyltransferase [Chryseomicrobium palamuruense]|uniref:Orotate phosphoribosyltransferase n=1 Tax=Chryseomicrobium palamuruense TaxID=682973 RepID=A0ABV8UTK8_9BACL